MAQNPGRPCPNCGTLIAAGQRFCTNCGATLEGQPSSPPPYSYGPQQQQQQYPPQYQPVPPPYAQAPQQSQVDEALGLLGLWYLLRYGRRRRYYAGQGRRQSSGCCGCLVALVILLLLLGGVSYTIRTVNPALVNRALISIKNGSIATQPPITTKQINETATYASVDITVVSAEQSLAFLDDSDTSTTGMVRLTLRESNNSSRGASFSYNDAFHLILPDKTSIAPVNQQQFSPPDAGVTRTNWLDFPVSMKTNVSQLILQLGTNSEAQINVPLTGNANLKQYQPITVRPSNASTNYAGLTWTITSATSSLSRGGKQANTNTLFVTVTLKVDNPSSKDFNAYWGDYIRLKSGDTTSPPLLDATLPLNFPAGSSGAKGDVTFSMPQGSNSYTLIFLGNPNTQVSQASIDFRVG
jgi:zinc-ribbon domain